jgi:hypothetical protein
MFFSRFDAKTTLRLVCEAGFTVVDSHKEAQAEGATKVTFLWVLAKK